MNLRHLALFGPLVALVAFGCVVGTLSGDAAREGEKSGEPAGEPCADDPLKCKAGTTCWPAADGGATCVASKPYKTKGSDCELLLGRSSCADGLVCITVSKPVDAGADTGKDAGPMVSSTPISLCAPWCDDKHPCPAGEDCRALSFEGYAGRACVPSNLATPDTGVPDTAMPDTYRPDTFKPDTFKPDDGVDTTVTDAPMDTAMDTTPPADTEPPPDTATPDTADAD